MNFSYAGRPRARQVPGFQSWHGIGIETLAKDQSGATSIWKERKMGVQAMASGALRVTELTYLEKVIEGLLRAWIPADDDSVEMARHRVERAMEGRDPEGREACEAALTRLEWARLQARLRNRERPGH